METEVLIQSCTYRGSGSFLVELAKTDEKGDVKESAGRLHCTQAFEVGTKYKLTLTPA